MISWVFISLLGLYTDDARAKDHQSDVNSAIKEAYIRQEQSEKFIESESMSQDTSATTNHQYPYSAPVPSTNNSLIQVDPLSSEDRCWNAEMRSPTNREVDPEGDILTIQSQNALKEKHDEQLRNVYLNVINERLKKANVRLPTEVSRELESRVYGRTK